MKKLQNQLGLNKVQTTMVAIMATTTTSLIATTIIMCFINGINQF